MMKAMFGGGGPAPAKAPVAQPIEPVKEAEKPKKSKNAKQQPKKNEGEE
jgi:hypothetical protein